jgi:alpha-D-ribose 1-methylphosphonate 5-triphosphate synthase subunit PhnH
MTPGFADPVADAQASFRAMMEATARPGRIQSLPVPAGLPLGLHAAGAAAVLTLADAETPLWTDAGAEARDWIVFHTGAPLVADPAEADFLLAIGAPPALSSLRAGTDEAPQEGATLILQVRGLMAGSGWCLTGPGIADRHALLAEGLQPGFAAAWAEGTACFPRGCDLFLAAGDRIAALPRTTRIVEPA